jgi:hypothetical protein
MHPTANVAMCCTNQVASLRIVTLLAPCAGLLLLNGHVKAGHTEMHQASSSGRMQRTWICAYLVLPTP